MAALEPEVPGQSAASRVEQIGLDADGVEEAQVGVHVHDRLVVAVALDDRVGGEPRRLPVRGVTLEELSERERVVAEAAGVLIVGEKFAEVVAEHGGAAGLESDDRDAVADVGGERIEGAAELLLRGGELAGGDPGQAAAQRLLGDGDFEAGVLEDVDGCDADVGVEVIGEGVGPERHRLAAAAGGLRPVAQRATGEAREVAGGVDASGPLGELLQTGGVGEEVDEAWRLRGDAGQLGQPAHRIVGCWSQPAGVMVSEELGLVGGHVDVDRTVTEAAFAGKAQIEGIPDRFGAPSVMTSPRSISNSRRARPRVESFSSRVTM